MNFPRLPLVVLLLGASFSPAATRYVDLNSANPTPPYISWATAATNIQDAVDAALAGDEVLASNGVYAVGGRAVEGALTNRVAIDKPIALRSVNGPQFTVIQGRQLPGGQNGDGAIRCVYLAEGASLSGFTIQGGATRAFWTSGGPYQETSGGGVWGATNGVIVSNCVIVGNSAFRVGGGIHRAWVLDSIIASNKVTELYNAFGGGASECSLSGCSISRNTSANSAGGVFGGYLSNCVIVGNSTPGIGGGALGARLEGCVVGGNTGSTGGGSYFSQLNNCLVVSNTATETGGGASYGTLTNCTVVGNSAPEGGGVRSSEAYNCIIYYNSESNYSGTYSDKALINCCITPLNWNYRQAVTNEPGFVDLGSGNFQLKSNSPCINSGNNAYSFDGVDFQGSPRLVGGTVDIGAYEYQSPASLLSYAWLQQYGLPADGSADFEDGDGDGMNTYGEWRSDTIPTNAASVLKMVGVTNGPVGVGVSWQSVATRSYWLERSTNLDASDFELVATHILGVTGTKTFTDSTTTNGMQLFNRVGVQ